MKRDKVIFAPMCWKKTSNSARRECSLWHENTGGEDAQVKKEIKRTSKNKRNIYKGEKLKDQVVFSLQSPRG